ncbi:hypothetical protein GCM10027075_64760 [Streptomyces heilongjiangensis]
MTRCSATCSGSLTDSPSDVSGGVREERKLKLRLVVTERTVPAEDVQGRAALNLRLSLQTQHAPPIAATTGPRPRDVEMPVQVRPAQLDVRWSKGRTRRHDD